jgi:hypothetical protein
VILRHQTSGAHLLLTVLARHRKIHSLLTIRAS